MRLQLLELTCFKPRAEVGDVVYYISPNNRYAVMMLSSKMPIQLKITRRLPAAMMLCSTSSPVLLSVSMSTRPASPHCSMS